MKLSELKTEINSIMDIDKLDPDDIVKKIIYFNHENSVVLVDNIEQCSATACGTTVELMKSGSRKPETVRARWFVYDYCHNNLNRSMSELGRRYGQDHSTVSCAARALENAIETKFPDTVIAYEKFNELIKNQKDEHKNTLVTVAK